MYLIYQKQKKRVPDPLSPLSLFLSDPLSLLFEFCSAPVKCDYGCCDDNSQKEIPQPAIIDTVSFGGQKSHAPEMGVDITIKTAIGIYI